MLHARIVGSATATICHPKIKGCRHLVCEVLDQERKPTGRIVMAADWLGAGRGSEVLVSADGDGANKYLKTEDVPLRNVVVAIVDELRKEAGS